MPKVDAIRRNVEKISDGKSLTEVELQQTIQDGAKIIKTISNNEDYVVM